MKKRFLTAVAILSAISMNLMATNNITSVAKVVISSTPDGVLNEKAVFSVNNQGKKVYFSKGNLQYCPTNNTEGPWRFASEQYEVVGNTSDNKYPSSTMTTWTDLFSFGNTGVAPAGKTAYDPCWSAGNSGDTGNSDGCHWSSTQTEGTEYDFGVGFAIKNGGNQAGKWRGLTYNEWKWILFDRPNASSKMINVSYDSKILLCIAPDDYTFNGVTTNSTIDATQYQTLENNGCVFLNSRGYRMSRNYGSDQAQYWTSTSNSQKNGGCIYNMGYLDHVDWIMMHSMTKNFGYYVRLVMDKP